MSSDLIIRDLEFSYVRRGKPQVAVEALRLASGVNFVVGLNGSGKSTLLKLLAGLLPYNAASIALNNQPLPPDGPGRRGSAGTGYLKQDFSLRGRTSTISFLRYGAWMHGVNGAQLESRCQAVLREVGLEGVAAAGVGRLSGGMQRRLGIAVEITHEPILVLLDEPTSGLDHDAREKMHRIVEQLERRGAIILISSHEEAEISRYEAELHVMRDGRLVRSIHHAKSTPVDLAKLLDGK